MSSVETVVPSIRWEQLGKLRRSNEQIIKHCPRRLQADADELLEERQDAQLTGASRNILERTVVRQG